MDDHAQTRGRRDDTFNQSLSRGMGSPASERRQSKSACGGRATDATTEDAVRSDESTSQKL